MARIAMSNTFVVVPEGVHVFQITDVKYDEAFGEMQIFMRTAQGMTHRERFHLLDANSNPNDKALNAFSYFAKTALNDYSVTEIEETDLIGHFIRCEVKHDIRPSTKDPSKTVTFVQLGDKSPASGFDAVQAAPAPAAPAQQTKVAATVDLDSLLD